MKYKALSSILVVFIFLSVCSRWINGLRSNFNAKQFTRLATANTKPLSTVPMKFKFGNIPRLEFGIRFLRKLPKSYYDKIIFVNPLEWLTNGEVQERYVQNVQSAPGELFKKVIARVTSITSSFVNYVKRVFASVLVASTTLAFPNFKRFSVYAGTAIASVSMFPSITQAGVFKKYQNLKPTQKLATTPLFYVCNPQGNPYLQDDVQAGNPDQKIIVYFMSSEDANDYMLEMAQSSPSNVNEFRVMATSMEKIVNKIQTRKQSRKMGRYSMNIVYRIQPSSRQCENAELVAGKGDVKKGSEALKGVSIPMFSAKGMGVKRSNGEIVTPYYFAYEDLLEDWQKVVDESKGKQKLPSKPVVAVRDFVDVMCLSQGLHTDSLLAGDRTISSVKSDITEAVKIPAIVPPRREIDMLKAFYRNEGFNGQYQAARIVGMPRQ